MAEDTPVAYIAALNAGKELRAARVDNARMAPEIREGELIIFDVGRAPQDGGLVVGEYRGVEFLRRWWEEGGGGGPGDERRRHAPGAESGRDCAGRRDQRHVQRGAPDSAAAARHLAPHPHPHAHGAPLAGVPLLCVR